MKIININMKPVLSFVVIEYFSIEEINQCVNSIISEIKDIPFEIIVSSNSQYTLAQRENILQNEHIHWIFNEKNGGFAYGMNKGLAKANGKYKIIMNPDVKIKKGILSMVRFMDENLFVGAIAPKIISEQGEVQDSCRPYVSLQGYIKRSLSRIINHRSTVLSDSFDYNRIQTVDWVIGAFIMVRDRVVNDTLGLDEHYFMYAEDLDWCTRIRSAGYEIVYYPKAVIEYKGSRTARKSIKYAKIFFKSHLYYWRKFGFLTGYPKRKSIIWDNVSVQ